MTIGPLQLVFIRLKDEQRTLPISQELKAVRKNGIIRLVDMLYVTKDMTGKLVSKEISDLSEAEKAQYGIILQGLLGMRAAQKSGEKVDEIAKAMSLTPGDFGINSEQVKMMSDGLPNGGSAMLVLFEHLWAVRLKEAMLNAGGELVTQGILSPETLALGGTTLEEAMAAADKIEAEAEKSAQEQLAVADQKLADAKEQAAAKTAEAQRILDEAEAQSAEKMAQAKVIAAAAIAAGVRTASEEIQQADQHKAQSEQEAQARIAQSEAEARAKIAQGAEIAAVEVASGHQVAQQKIAEGVQTAEEIKNAAALEALRILVEAELIKREAARQAVETLVAASMIKQSAAEQSINVVLRPKSLPPSK